MRGEGRIHTKGKKVGHCRVSQRLLSMIVAVRCSHLQNVQTFSKLALANCQRKAFEYALRQRIFQPISGFSAVPSYDASNSLSMSCD